MISRLPPSATELERFEAIEKDINKTADFISKSSKLLLTTDVEGVIQEADGKPNIEDIFGSNYDPESKKIQLGSIEIEAGRGLSKDEAKKLLMTGIFGITSNQFSAIKKQTKKVYTLVKDDIQTKEDAIMYLAELPLREQHRPILEKIDSIKEEAELVRTKYIDKEKKNKFEALNLIDRQITGTRAMIDSITKASTHVSTAEVHQKASRHSDEDLQQLEDAVKNNQYISDVEIDADADVLKVVNLINQIKNLKLNLDTDFTLKVRKLGNYKAAGICVPAQNIVAVNIDRPSSLIHELTHLVDLTNETIKGSDQRSILIEKFRGKLSLDDHAGKQGYYSSDEEIIARLGEISYLLNKFNYNGGDFKDFIASTQDLEENDESMCVVKNLSTYMSNADIYFGIGKDGVLEEKDLLEIRDYYKTYWGVDKDYVAETKIYTQEDREKYARSNKNTRKNKAVFTPTSFSNITENTVVESYKCAKTEGVMDQNEFAKDILVNMKHLFRSKKRIRGEEVSRQFRTVDNLYRSIIESGDDSDKVDALISLMEHTGSYYLGATSALSKHLENLPLDEAKDLYSEMTYTNSEGIEYPKNEKSDATDYLNDYGQRSAKKMTSLLTCDLVKDLNADSINEVLDHLKPNTKAFYELVLIRQELATDEQNDLLKMHLKDKGWLSLFKFDRVGLLGKRLSMRYRSLMTVSEIPLNAQEKSMVYDAYKTIVSEFKEYRGEEVTVIDLCELDNLDQIMSDEIELQMKTHWIETQGNEGEDTKKQLVQALLGDIKGSFLKEIGNAAEENCVDWAINKPPTQDRKKAVVQEVSRGQDN